jgi:hypothetical protein
MMAEKSMVSKGEPRRPGREPLMHKMRTREIRTRKPVPAETHAAAHGAEMRPSTHTAGMHASAHTAGMHTPSHTTAMHATSHATAATASLYR